MKNVHLHTLGYPRIGARRELKFALEAYWRGQQDAAALEDCGRRLRARHWAAQRDAGLDLVTVGDFAFYDHVANHLQLFGAEPARFGFTGAEPELERYFAMARGQRDEQACCAAHADSSATDRRPLEMTKWFDTNYHYLVPEYDEHVQFRLASPRLFNEVAEAQALGHAVKPVLLGPLTLLWLGKEKGSPGWSRLALLERLLPAYCAALERLRALGVRWVQLDEPILGLDLPAPWRNAYERAYWTLNQSGLSILLATYFSPLEENISLACRLPVAGLHVDGVRAPQELASAADWLPAHKVLSVGIVDGRNIWRTDLDAALGRLRPLLDKRGGQLWLAPSCSLLHLPYSLRDEDALDPELRSWLAFADEKLAELSILRTELGSVPSGLGGGVAAAREALAGRRASTRVHRAAVRERLAALALDTHADRRASPFAVRAAAQRARLRLPDFPTTTIGSFPQTQAIRAARAAYKRGELAQADYDDAMRAAIADAIARQQALGLDVLVHGEAERNDMVEYFGEQLDGYAFTAHGWVQSYGSRCVKPPILYGDVQRPAPMTVAWARHAQSLTEQPVKGMLTGPITMLQWSFVREDQPREITALQLALAIRDEVRDLEAAGIAVIQVDEPALREGLPLRQSRAPAYLAWAGRAFRVAVCGAADSTQIHTHMCYCEFNDILPDIAALDADVITIETSRSDMELLAGFGHYRYPNDIGPGVYDIHSPRVPAQADIERLLRKAAQVIAPERLWVNPDCGLKTRGWSETEAALRNMVAAARALRATTFPSAAVSQ